MNCFAHALPYLDQPHFMVGCCIPDWLSSADRKCRTREKSAAEFTSDGDGFVADVARGVVQHHRDDQWFHQTQTFSELNMSFSVQVRQRLGGESGFRAGLVGHIIVEMLLDAYLTERFPGKLEVYYERVAAIAAGRLQSAINRFATRPTNKLVYYVERYLSARFLFDYLDDRRLLFRINNVLQRVKLAPIDGRLLGWIPGARNQVYQKAPQLLCRYPIDLSVAS